VSAVSQRTRDRIIVRDLGMCQRCGRTITTGGNLQHRRARGAGGRAKTASVNFPENLLLLCGSGTTGCHGQVTHNPLEARANGWEVSVNATAYGPEDVPALGRDTHGEQQWHYFDGFDRIPVPRDTAVMRLVALGIRKDGM
jgi:hypothetical protein